MNKIKLSILLILPLTILCGCSKPEICNFDAKGQNIVCFGDSITFGYGANAGEDYPAALGKMISIPVVNCGVDGDTTFDALERLENDVLNKKPRLVIVEFCGNDFLKKIPREETIKNLEKIIDRIQQKGAMVALVDISSGFFFQEYRKAFKNLASKKKTVFIPVLLNKIITNPAMKSDFFHPNARGYQVIAKRIYQAIIPYLK
jgi:acyl-CoA thioesterase I